MRYFMDTEFIERGPKHPLELISIGIVGEDGREFYATNADCDLSTVNAWVRENVVPHLTFDGLPFTSRCELPIAQLSDMARQFIGNDPAPEFWGYFCAYDWVIFCQLFGDMSQLPKGFPYFCHDLRQALDHEALYHINQPDDAPHNALLDARWIAATWREHLNWGQQ